MILQISGKTIEVSCVRDLGGANAQVFRDEVLDAQQTATDSLDLDLSQTRSLDSHGLGALLHLQKAFKNVRLRNPTPQVLQLLELTRMESRFDIVQAE